MSELRTVPTNRIVPNPDQPREEFDPTALQELADSIATHGIRQFPTVYHAADTDFYVLDDGERRWRAAQLAGLEMIEVVVIGSYRNGSGNLDRLVKAVVANAHREDLNPIERAKAYRQMHDMGLNYRLMARDLGCSENHITTHLRLLEYEPEIQKLVAQGKLPRDGRVSDALLAIPDSEARVKLARRMCQLGAGIRAIITAANRLTAQIAPQSDGTLANAEPAVATLPRQPDRSRTVRWPKVQAAMRGACDACDNNPKLSDLPEPGWALILDAAGATCRKCSVRPASVAQRLLVCSACPAVELLSRLVKSDDL